MQLQNREQRCLRYNLGFLDFLAAARLIACLQFTYRAFAFAVSPFAFAVVSGV